jgi:drug/metabolite transporter (DMT)-like permease
MPDFLFSALLVFVILGILQSVTSLLNLLIAIVFLRGREEINLRTIAGTVCVVVGSVAIALSK